MEDVSKRTGLSVSTLSKMEKGNVSLSYEKLHLISRGLGVDLVQVLDSEEIDAPAAGLPRAGDTPFRGRASTGRRVVQRSGEGMTVGSGNYGQTYLATELLNKRLTPIITEVKIRTLDEFFSEHGGFSHHPGEEFSFVLEGQIEFHTELYAPTLLNPGDSVYFDTVMGHAFLAVGDGPCRLLTVCETAAEVLPEAVINKESAVN